MPSLLRLAHGEEKMLIDGGLATALEERGFSIADPLWSAKVLAENPDAILAIHGEYLRAGAQCITTASYQASFPGFARAGFSDETTVELLRRSTTLALTARENFLATHSTADRPLVAASIGPYGAFLNDGSEYRGYRDVENELLRQYHARRLEILAETPCDLLAIETIPCLQEMRVLVDLLRQTTEKWAWFSFTCRDEKHLASGEPIEEVAVELSHEPLVLGIGVNCTQPKYVAEILRRLRRNTAKPLLAYPNSGEIWNPAEKKWVGFADPDLFAFEAHQWLEVGATIVGGCCRTTPQHIQILSEKLFGKRT